MVFLTNCSIFRHQNKTGGVITESRPHGRLQPGEIDNMSGKENFMPVKKSDDSGESNKKSGSENVKSKKMSKKEQEKYNNQYGHWQTKKNKRKK